MAQILTDIYEGYVMYSQMREYKSIRNFRFKKLKRYKIAKMKHQLHTLKDSGNYKPNLVVRVLTHLWETQKYLWGSVFYDSFKKVFKVGSNTNQQVEVKDWRYIVEQQSAHLTDVKDKFRYHREQWSKCITQRSSMSYDNELELHEHMRLAHEYGSQLSQVTLEPKQPKKVEEPRKITHVKYIGNTWKYAVKGKVYKVTQHNVYPNGNEYFNLTGEFNYDLCSMHKEGGVLNEDCKRDYEIIYDYEIV